MDVYPTIMKDDQPLIVTEESENDGYQTSEIGDKVADWMAKAYGSKNRKRSYYDPQEKVNISFKKLGIFLFLFFQYISIYTTKIHPTH